jgi:hypothetical protein
LTQSTKETTSTQHQQMQFDISQLLPIANVTTLPFGVICEFRYNDDENAFRYTGPPSATLEQQYGLPEQDMANTLQVASDIIEGKITPYASEEQVKEQQEDKSNFMNILLPVTCIAAILTCGCALIILLPAIIVVLIMNAAETEQKKMSQLEQLVREENTIKYNPRGLKLVMKQVQEKREMDPMMREHHERAHRMHTRHHRHHHRHHQQHLDNMQYVDVVVLQLMRTHPQQQQPQQYPQQQQPQQYAPQYYSSQNQNQQYAQFN